jgi:hypothetical protein
LQLKLPRRVEIKAIIWARVCQALKGCFIMNEAEEKNHKTLQRYTKGTQYHDPVHN